MKLMTKVKEGRVKGTENDGRKKFGRVLKRNRWEDEECGGEGSSHRLYMCDPIMCC